MSSVSRKFFHGSTVEIAKKLIGCTIKYNSPKGVIAGIINETEAYTEEDPACHAFNGQITSRNRSMFKEAGHLYIYLIYGMYHCVNIVTESAGFGSAVLLRSVIPTEGIDLMKKNRNYSGKEQKQLCNGPGKFCLAFGWDRSLDALDLINEKTPVTLHHPTISPNNIITTPRIGISKGQELPWRFVWNGQLTSRKNPYAEDKRK